MDLLAGSRTRYLPNTRQECYPTRPQRALLSCRDFPGGSEVVGQKTSKVYEMAMVIILKTLTNQTKLNFVRLSAQIRQLSN